jgi:hypothetical protein
MKMDTPADSADFAASREDVAVAFCPHCGRPCEQQIPGPKGKWRCQRCLNRCRMPVADLGARLKYLLQCLRSSRPAVVEMAQAGLIAYDKQAVGPLLAELERRPFLGPRIAPVLGRIGDTTAVDVLLNEVRRRERQIRWKKWFWRWVSVAVIIMIIRATHWWWIIFFGLGYLSVEAFLPYRRAAIDALKELGDVRAAGPIAKMHRQRDLRKEASNALLVLLPRLKGSHASMLSGSERAAINDLVWDRNRALALTAVQALVHVGNERSVGALRALVAARPESHPVAQAARDAIPELQRRLKWRAEQATLLRAAGAVGDEDPKSLLRPAAGHDEIEQQTLLRPAENDG